MKVTAIVPSAGKGRRLKRDIDKVFVLLDNKPILYHTLKSLEKIKEIEEIILVVSRRSLDYTRDYFLKRFRFQKPIKVIRGGRMRADSVWNGLKEIDKSTDLVLIHDGARPFAEEDLFKKVIKAGKEFGASVLGVPLSFTIKRVKNSSFVLETIPRENIWEIQTPQVFKRDLLLSCYQKARKEKFRPTDDAQVLERYGYKIKIVEGSPLNIKITRPEDLVLAKAILNLRNGFVK